MLGHASMRIVFEAVKPSGPFASSTQICTCSDVPAGIAPAGTANFSVPSAFRLAGLQPAGGSPVVVLVSNAGMSSSDPSYASSLEPINELLYQFLDAGFTVVRACLTSSASFGGNALGCRVSGLAPPDGSLGAEPSRS